jgi:polyisoprenoid-binding protein YceI
MTTTTWKIDAAHTDVGFSTKHMMVTTVRGRFTDVDGTITVDEENPTTANVEIKVKVASVVTGSDKRDAHLRSADFFDAETYPEIAVKVSSIEHVSGDDYKVTADLTIRETTRPLTLKVTNLGFYQGFQGRRVGFEATATLNREDWGLTYNMALEAGGWVVGKEIKLQIDLAADQVVEGATVEVPVAA